ncbi:hypothetical protein Tco_1208431, partial [Tanacetum coccineum]
LVSTYGKAKGRKTIKLHKFFNNSRRNVKVLMNCEKNELRCKRGCDDEDGMMWYRKRRRLSHIVGLRMNRLKLKRVEEAGVLQYITSSHRT